jgi:uncharacterized protein (DUF302 family)
MPAATQDKLSIRLETTKSVDEVAETIERLAPEHRFRVLTIHDVQQTLREKGFQREPLKIVEICSAGFAHQALKKSIDVSLLMPCKYSVYKEGNKTVVALARPSVISETLPGIGLEELAAGVEATLKTIMEKAV